MLTTSRPRFTKLPLASVLFAGLLCSAGCSEDELFGGGEPPADVSVSTPSGVQSGDVTLIYTLTGDDGEVTDISVSYSTGGSVFRNATAGTGGDGVQDLTMSESGDLHTYVWDSQADLPGQRESTVSLRIRPTRGTSDTTGSIRVQNAQFLAAIEEAQVGRIRLSLVDVNDGTLAARSSVPTGGTDPYDVIFEKGFFLVAHRSSNDVAVLELDETNEELVAVPGSPFDGDGIGARHLVTNGKHVFVSNTTSESITIFNFDTSTGALELNGDSNVGAPGCQGLAIRSGWLYVASGASDEILIFDIAADGQLLLSAASPVASGGLNGPLVFTRVASFLYVTNANASTLSGFSIGGTGALTALGSSPFSISASAQRLVVNGTDLFAVSGAAAGVLSFDTDALGTVTEDPGSPLALGGSSFAVATVGRVVVAATTTTEAYRVYTISGSGLTEAPGSPHDAGAPILRATFSDE